MWSEILDLLLVYNLLTKKLWAGSQKLRTILLPATAYLIRTVIQIYPAIFSKRKSFEEILLKEQILVAFYKHIVVIEVGSG